jgi:Kef-type K+ transport system membrane component KefB
VVVVGVVVVGVVVAVAVMMTVCVLMVMGVIMPAATLMRVAVVMVMGVIMVVLVVVVGMGGCRAARFVPEGSGANGGDDDEGDAAEQDGRVELRPEQQIQHARLPEVQAQADHAERAAEADHAELVEVIRIGSVVVVMMAVCVIVSMRVRMIGHGNTFHGEDGDGPPAIYRVM